MDMSIQLTRSHPPQLIQKVIASQYALPGAMAIHHYGVLIDRMVLQFQILIRGYQKEVILLKHKLWISMEQYRDGQMGIQLTLPEM